jgi:hypothetical protein
MCQSASNICTPNNTNVSCLAAGANKVLCENETFRVTLAQRFMSLPKGYKGGYRASRNAIPASERSRARWPDRVRAHRNTSSVEPPRRNASSIPRVRIIIGAAGSWPGIDDRATAPERIHPSPPHFEQLHHCPHGFSLKTRCTTLVPTPSVLPILRMPSPLALSSSMRASTEDLTRRRPSLVPFALARASPAFTRSRMMPRSNSANRR